MEALHLKAKKDLVDRTGITRKTGESYLIRTVGPYMPSVDEEVIRLEKPQLIYDN
jgi:hypothetical protein